MAFDPGLHGTGFASFTCRKGRRTRIHERVPQRTGIIKPWGVTLNDKLDDMIDKLHSIIGSSDPAIVVVEWPQYFASGRGNTSASRGDLGKLYLAASCIVVVALQRKIEVKMVEVNDWKGQLPKHVVQARICKLLEVSSDRYNSHEWDAVGLGLWQLGVFK